MPQLFPGGPSAVNLNALQESGGINVPDEPASEFDTPGMQGSMQQLLSENLGKYVMADFLIGVSSIVRRVGILYSVGRGFVVLYDESTHAFEVCDIFSLKFATFFPPGFEPTLEELLSGAFPSGILSPFTPSTASSMSELFPTSGTGARGGGMMNNGGTSSMGTNSGTVRNSSSNGCRTLGQR